MKKLFVKIFPFLFKTQWLVKPAHEVKPAFTHEGVEYFMFVNEQNMPAERAFAAMDIYEELNQRITREYLESYFEAVLQATNKGDLVKVANMTTFAKQRLDHITNVEILYKLASVLYFTKEENCYSYDYEFNEKKIASWKKSKDIDAFFLKTPISGFLPSFDGSNLNTQIYTLLQNKEMLKQLEHHLSILLESGKSQDTIIKLRSQMENLKKWNESLG